MRSDLENRKRDYDDEQELIELFLKVKDAAPQPRPRVILEALYILKSDKNIVEKYVLLEAMLKRLSEPHAAILSEGINHD